VSFLRERRKCVLLLACACGAAAAQTAESQVTAREEQSCRALAGFVQPGPTGGVSNLAILSAAPRTTSGSGVGYCYVRGFIPPGIQYHVQLPFPGRWNERFLHWGDGGKDGGLNLADHRVAQGYAVANSNMGHDAGSEPGASFGFNNRQSEIDFGYRAVHLTVNAAKTLIRAYYGRPPKYSYHEGCSTGGREGLIEAQRFPYDFDGIVAGAPVNYYQQLNAAGAWLLQRIYRDRFAGAPAFDTDGDGRLDSLSKLKLLERAVLEKCDAIDGITDGVIDDPHRCRVDPAVDLNGKLCRGDVNADHCFTRRQLQTIADFYRGARDSKGVRVYWGKAPGSEFGWAQSFIPHPGNGFFPGQLAVSGDHLNFIFYENDPGVPPPNLGDVSYKLDKRANPPEWAWWEFDIDDVTAGKGSLMMSIMNATDPDLTRFLVNKNGKLLLYHGWCDAGPAPDGTVEYFNNVVKTTFAGNLEQARQRIRLFMVPGMGHCGGGPGPNSWDKLTPLVEWVEQGKAPDFVVARHSTGGKIDNERPICAFPQKAVYTGPSGGQNNPINWVAANFACR